MAAAQSNQTIRPAKIGFMLPHMEKLDGQRSWAQIREMAELGEAIGMDSLWGVDHFLFKLDNDDPPRGIWECWSLLSALAACTKTVELGTLVLGTGFRNPARWRRAPITGITI
jgi:alkanesulfonate monooxygenase SsuD/methylene tetrahydromethanopterin reductase-like flavin-dependent oxidoreductase (luciferase family)